MSFAKSLKDRSAQWWERGYKHPFLQEMGQGTLSQDSFRFYLLQDYLYLLSYAKVFATAMVKADTEQFMADCASMQDSILNGEMQLHREYMASFGITKEQVASVKPSLYHKAYTANMLAVSQTGGAAEILAAVLPCAWSYADYAARLAADYADKLEGNFYRSWIETYTSEAYIQSYQWMFPTLDRLCEGKSVGELERIEEAFSDSVEFEYLFWDMAYRRNLHI